MRWAIKKPQSWQANLKKKKQEGGGKKEDKKKEESSEEEEEEEEKESEPVQNEEKISEPVDQELTPTSDKKTHEKKKKELVVVFYPSANWNLNICKAEKYKYSFLQGPSSFLNPGKEKLVLWNMKLKGEGEIGVLSQNKKKSPVCF